jgi:hypothetical protein
MGRGRFGLRADARTLSGRPGPRDLAPGHKPNAAQTKLSCVGGRVPVHALRSSGIRTKNGMPADRAVEAYYR